MLEIIVPSTEYYDNKNNLFIYSNEQKLVLEHSLVSISKWESRWKKPYSYDSNKTPEEFIDYIRCMTITQNVDDKVYSRLTQEQIDKIVEYINDPMTATTIRDIIGNSQSRTFVTSELIYYWMFSYNISIECQKWHLNRLMTLIKIFDVNNRSEDKMSENDILESNAKRNAEMRAKYHSKG